MTGLPVVDAIATCIRRMQSQHPSEMLAATIALWRVLAMHGRTFDDLADWILAQCNREEEMLAAARELAVGIEIEAAYAGTHGDVDETGTIEKAAAALET